MPATNKFKGLLNRRFFDNLLPIPAQNELELGSIAPEIQIDDVRNDQKIKLSDYRGVQPVVLYFTRIFTDRQYCPFCDPQIISDKLRKSRVCQEGKENV
jgi:AhpC/TSA family